MNNKRILEIREEEHIVKMKRMETMPTAPKQPSKITQIVERGHIFFFYRPTTIEIDCDTKKDWFKQDHAINCIEDVSRFYMLLKPDPSMSAKAKNRLLTMTAKQMPRLDCHDMKGALVSLASDDLEEITQYLHGTVSWEGLIVPPARPCGEGIYELVRHGFSGPLHFIYELELPEKIGDVQKAFNIGYSASYTISVKNPDTTKDPQHRPLLSQQQKDHFRGQRVEYLKWASLEPSFLDVVFTFYLFVTNGTDLIREDAGLGSVAIGIDAQRSMEMGIARFNYGSDHVEQKLYEDLNVRKNELGPNDAITTGNFS